MTTASKAKAKAPAVTKTRRVFPIGQCHHRNAAGAPDCKKAIVAKRANLCPEHEKVWQAAARLRYAANRAAKNPTAAPKSSRAKAAASAPADAAPATPATAPEDLEAALAASNARFATPELAEKARAKRAAQSS